MMLLISVTTTTTTTTTSLLVIIIIIYLYLPSCGAAESPFLILEDSDSEVRVKEFLVVKENLPARCCATNFSVATDSDGEFLAIAIDNVLCEAAFKNVKAEALASTWQTNDEHVERKITRRENVYEGNFPGRTSSVSAATQALIQSCILPLLLGDNIPIESESELEVEVELELESGFFATHNQALLTSDMLSMDQRMPHIDNLSEKGLASVFGVHVMAEGRNTGTVLCRDRMTGKSILARQEDEITVFEYWRRKCNAERGCGYFTENGHVLVDGIIVVPTRENRISMYYWNHLHTLYVKEGREASSSSGRFSRVTLSQFWALKVEDTEEKVVKSSPFVAVPNQNQNEKQNVVAWKHRLFQLVSNCDAEQLETLLSSKMFHDSEHVNDKALLHGGYGALHVAAERGHGSCLEVLLRHKQLDVNAEVAHSGDSALHLAAARGSEDIVLQLLMSGARQYSNAMGETPFLIATRKGHLGVVGLLAAATNDK